MTFNNRGAGGWSQATPKLRRGGEWVELGSEGSSDEAEESPIVEGPRDGGFTWDQTFTDTSWVSDEMNVEVVDTLDYSASGGLEEAVNSADSYPTVVVFEVGGVIDLDGDNFHVNNGPVWVAGETAPDPGISIIRGRTRCYADDVILSHLGFYLGDGPGQEEDCVAPDGDDQIYDHCTIMWGTDECVGASNAVHGVSFLNCIVAEGLHDSVHSQGYHSRGMLFNDEGTSDVCIMGTLFANNNRRNPMGRYENLVLVNNWIYNWGGNEGESGNIINFNTVTPDVTAQGLRVTPGGSSDTSREVFSYSANLYHDDILQDDSGQPLSDGSQETLSSPPTLPSGLDLADTVPASEIDTWVQVNAGMRPASRPATDAAFVANRLQSGQELVDSQDDVGGYPDYSQASHTLEVPGTGLVDWIQGMKVAVETGT